MINLSKNRRNNILSYLNELKESEIQKENIITIKEIETEITSKKYGLVWEQHFERVDEEIKTKIPVFIEETQKEIIIDEKLKYNFILEGDNLHSLLLLEKTHNKGIDVIYIDPPYNTGNKDFIYNDKCISKDDDFRHSKWLSFMDKRLRIAAKLLKLTGVIFISIDDNELATLKLLCDEIFGISNYEGTITYVRKTSGKQDSSNFAKSTEYILVYSKAGLWECNYLEAGERIKKRYNKIDFKTGKIYREVDLRKTGSNDRRIDRLNLYYPFYYNEKSGDLFCEKEKLKEIPDGYIEIYPIKADGTEGNWRWEYNTANKNKDLLIAHIMPKYKEINKWTIYEKDFIDKKEEARTIKEQTFWHRKEFNSDNAIADFTKLGFNNKDFSFPKSVELLKHIFQLATNRNSLVLDFFAGSGTSAEAIFKLNDLDGGNRRIILCNEKEICRKVTYKRVKKIVEGYEFKGKNEFILYNKKLSLRDLNTIEETWLEFEDVVQKNKGKYDKLKKEFKDGVLKLIAINYIEDKAKGINANIKYYKTDYIDKFEEFSSDKKIQLLKHIKELIQLEYGIKLSGNKYIILLNDEDADKLTKNLKKLNECEVIYMASNVLLTRKQEVLFNNLGIKRLSIPEYYFENELKEIGEY